MCIRDSRKPLTFQTLTSVRSNNISLKYQRFTTLGFKDKGIIKSEFVTKNPFLWGVGKSPLKQIVLNLTGLIKILCSYHPIN